MLEVKAIENILTCRLAYLRQCAEFSYVGNLCTCVYLLPIHTKLAPLCTDVAINLPDKTVNLSLGWAGCPHPGVHHKQMGDNWNGCLQMLQHSGMDSSHQAYICTDGETVCL